MLAVLIYTHAEVCVIALQTIITRNYICGYLLQCMANMWRCIRIINCRSNIVAFLLRSILRLCRHTFHLFPVYCYEFRILWTKERGAGVSPAPLKYLLCFTLTSLRD